MITNHVSKGTSNAPFLWGFCARVNPGLIRLFVKALTDVMKNVLLFVLCVLFIGIKAFAQESFITAGSGGGFSGIVNVYKVSTDGKVWKGKGTADISYTECSKIKKKKARAFIVKASKEIRAAGDSKHPGNMYYFLSVSENGKDAKVTWGDPAQPAPEAVKKIYQEIIEAISSLKYKPVK